jgi:CheY-like chemotaxis protein/DNA-directed RNA polymerase specialized sigma24 family protein
MSNVKNEIVVHLPSLRRYARCLTGSQERGDRYVRVCLEAILADVGLISGHTDTRVALFRVFHALWTGILTPTETDPQAGQFGTDKLARHIRALPTLEREVLLLTTLSEFTLDQAATILNLTHEEADGYLASARADLDAQTTTRVLIIEDEPVIAFDLASIVTSMGHGVTGIADTQERAVEMARSRSPGIVLADIQLRDGSSGIDAVREILASIDVPVIFITAFPERLLTGELDEPTYLITKPFDPDALRVTISQALLLHPAEPVAAAG